MNTLIIGGRIGPPPPVVQARPDPADVALKSAPPPAPPRRMSSWRVGVVYGTLALIVGGHLYEIARQQEHWPFSNYPMWSRPITTPDLAHYRMVGLTDEPVPREVPLPRRYFEPMPSWFIDRHIAAAVQDGRAGDPGAPPPSRPTTWRGTSSGGGRACTTAPN